MDKDCSVEITLSDFVLMATRETPANNKPKIVPPHTHGENKKNKNKNRLRIIVSGPQMKGTVGVLLLGAAYR